MGRAMAGAVKSEATRGAVYGVSLKAALAGLAGTGGSLVAAAVDMVECGRDGWFRRERARLAEEALQHLPEQAGFDAAQQLAEELPHRRALEILSERPDASVAATARAGLELIGGMPSRLEEEVLGTYTTAVPAHTLEGRRAGAAGVLEHILETPPANRREAVRYLGLTHRALGALEREAGEPTEHPCLHLAHGLTQDKLRVQDTAQLSLIGRDTPRLALQALRSELSGDPDPLALAQSYLYRAGASPRHVCRSLSEGRPQWGPTLRFLEGVDDVVHWETTDWLLPVGLEALERWDETQKEALKPPEGLEDDPRKLEQWALSALLGSRGFDMVAGVGLAMIDELMAGGDWDYRDAEVCYDILSQIRERTTNPNTAAAVGEIQRQMDEQSWGEILPEGRNRLARLVQASTQVPDAPTRGTVEVTADRVVVGGVSLNIKPATI